ncbi:hypothetical protein B0O99DRAFT_690789 [Bisporella sp. PMI_857]|nr:hypothetical protein B0O99DRAFT_690789 [Bisporella sp. PMI_857]
MDSYPRFGLTEGAAAKPLCPCTSDHCFCLASTRQSRPPCISRSSTGFPLVTNTVYDPLIPSPPDLSSGQATGDPGAENPHIFFTAKLGGSNEKRVKRLVDVVQNFSNAEKLSGESCELFARQWSRVFNSEPDAEYNAEFILETAFETKVASRLRRLKIARPKIRKRDEKGERLWLVYLAHEVEYISQHNDIDHYTAKGVGRMSVAKTIARRYLDSATSNYKRSQNFVELLKEGGPSSLIEDWDTTSSTWEKNIIREDIAHIFAYRRDKLPHLDELARLHDPVVARTIVNGFLAYGWSFPELLRSSTTVMKALKPYLQEQRSHTDSGTLGPTVGLNITQPISLNARDLTDPAIIGNFYDDQTADPVMADNLGCSLNSLDELSTLGHGMTQTTDLSIELLQQTANGSDIDRSPGMFPQEAFDTSLIL